MKHTIEIHIGKLVLQDVNPGDLSDLRDAVEMELTRLFNEKGVPGYLSVSRRVSGIQAGQINLQSGARSTLLGFDIAHAVYHGFENSISADNK